MTRLTDLLTGINDAGDFVPENLSVEALIKQHYHV